MVFELAMDVHFSAWTCKIHWIGSITWHGHAYTVQMVFVYVREAKEVGQHAMGPAISDKGVWPVRVHAASHSTTLMIHNLYKHLAEQNK